MDIEEIIQTIVDNGKIEDMHSLSNILEDVIKIIKDYDYECYEKYEMELYKMAYGNTFNRKMAEEIVSNMKPYGKKWSLDETKEMQDRYGIQNIKPIDFFLVLNSAYNDFKDIFEDDIEMYIKYAIDFIEDEDAKPDKVFLYYTTIVE